MGIVPLNCFRLLSGDKCPLSGEEVVDEGEVVGKATGLGSQSLAKAEGIPLMAYKNSAVEGGMECRGGSRVGRRRFG